MKDGQCCYACIGRRLWLRAGVAASRISYVEVGRSNAFCGVSGFTRVLHGLRGMVEQLSLLSQYHTRTCAHSHRTRTPRTGFGKRTAGTHAASAARRVVGVSRLGYAVSQLRSCGACTRMRPRPRHDGQLKAQVQRVRAQQRHWQTRTRTLYCSLRARKMASSESHGIGAPSHTRSPLTCVA